MPSRTARRSGFTLVEVSLAITIAAVAMMAIVSLVPIAYDANRKSLDATRTAQLAEEILAAVRANAGIYTNRVDFASKVVGSAASEVAPNVVALEEWKPPSGSGKLILDGSRQDIEYTPFELKDTTLVSHDLSYQVQILNPGGALDLRYTSNANRLFKRVRVTVWPMKKEFASDPLTVESILVCKDLSNATP